MNVIKINKNISLVSVNAIKNKLYSKVNHIFKIFIRFTFVLSIPFFITGCAGVFVDSLGKSMITDESYSVVAKTLPPVKDGSGRLYLYRTESSTTSELYSGSGYKKNPTVCRIDENVYEIIWEVFRYFDLPEGKHKVACAIQIGKGVTKRFSYKGGANEIGVLISNAAETFVRVDLNTKKLFQPVLVESLQAREEMAKLPHQNGVFRYHSGIIIKEN